MAAAAVLVAALASCASDSTNEEPRGAATPSGSISVTPMPTPSTASDLAAASASALVESFYVIRNHLRTDPAQPLSQLRTVAISTELAAQKKLFKSERAKGLHQTGKTRIAELEVQGVSLENSDPRAGKVPTVQIDVCFDVSAVDLVNAQGQSVVSPDRPDTGWIRYSVSNYNWTSDPDGSWRVASSQDLKRTPCAAS